MTDISTFPPQPYADDDRALGEQITLLAGQLNIGNYQLLKLIATFDNRKAWSGGGTIRSCAHWLNWQCGIALGAAREKVRVAHCLEDLPLIDASFSIGEISYSKVRAMSRVATPENEDYLLTIAQFGTASHVEKVVGKYKNTTCADEDRPENDQQEARKLVYYQDEDGSWIIHAKLPAEAGSLVVKAIEAVATPIQQKQQEESARKSVSAETCSTQGLDNPNGLQNSYIQTRADALVSMAEHFLATSDQSTEFPGLKGSERCQIMLHVDINTLRQHSLRQHSLRQHSPEDYSGQTHCNLDNKQWISPKTAKRLACDATLVTVLEDEQGKVLNIGRRSRTVPASIKRALSLRDTSCRVPGCCQTKNLDAHHIQHWIDGGETSLDNLVQLCRHHHTQLHQGLFSIRVESTETMEEPHMIFLTPSGKRIEASFFPQFPEHSIENSQQALATAAPKVDAKTCVTQWRGETCDYGVAVEALLRRDGRLS